MVIKKYFFVFFLFIFILNFPFSSAFIGVSPGIYNINFEPNSERIFVFEFLGDSSNEYEIYAEGDLARYVTLSTDEIRGKGFVNVLLEFPSKIEPPGSHTLYIGAKEYSDSNNLVLLANMRGKIVVNVPYPGKYLTMDFNLENANIGEELAMTALLTSLGSEPVQTRGIIKIYDEKNNVVQEIDLGEYEILPFEKKSVDYSLKTLDYKAGKYFAEAVFEYENKKLENKKPFRLGELFIDITDATRVLTKNSINKFEVEIESFWNDPIKDVYAEIIILGYTTRFKTPSINLNAFEVANLSGYFDTSEIMEDNFNVAIKLFYEDKITEKFVKVKFKKEVNYVIIIAIAVGVMFLIFIIVLIFIAIRLRKIKDEITTKKKRKK